MDDRPHRASAAHPFADLVHDLRYGLRSLRATPTFTFVALGTLAVATGATTLIFSIVSGVLLKPLPYREPERLVEVQETMPGLGAGAVVYSNIDEYRRGAQVLDGIAGYAPSARNTRRNGLPERAIAVACERGLFRVLGAEPIAGRTFADDDPPQVAVVSAALAADRFGSAAAAVGEQITLDEEPFTVIGVMGERFQFPYTTNGLPGAAAGSRVDVWIPFEPAAGMAANRRYRIDAVVARIKPGASIAAAQRELHTIVSRVAAAFPDTDTGRGVVLQPLTETVTGDVRPALLLLMGAVVLVLLVACANVANLLLVRATTRAREMAVRVALGASRSRLTRQLLAEGALLSIAGASAGVALAWLGAPVLLREAAAKLPRVWEIAIDWRVFAFVAAITALTSLVFGIVPAIEAARESPSAALRGAAVVSGSRGRRALRDGLAAAEIALAFMLLAGAGLLLRELVRLQTTDTGMSAERVLTAHLSPALSPADYEQLVERVAALPGVRAAAAAQMLPLQYWGWSGTFAVRGRPVPLPGEQQLAELRYITPGYFEALGIPVTRGRSFLRTDAADAPRVIVVNEALVRQYLGDTNPVGLSTDRGTIVGVAGNVRQTGVDREPVPEIYYPVAQNIAQRRELGMSLIVRTEVTPASLAPALRTAIHDAHPHVAIFDVKTLDAIVSESMAGHALNTWLLTLFAAMAVVMACAGIYGVVSYAVTSRTREFGIRMALGADAARVLRLVAARGAALTVVGLAAGLAGAAALSRLLSGLLPLAEQLDPAVMGGAAVLLGLVATCASLVPAMRAARVDPLIAVRDE